MSILIKYNNTYHSTTKNEACWRKIKNSCINPSEEINYKDPKFRIGYIVRISKYKDILVRSYVPNRSEDIFMIKKKIENTVLWTYAIIDLNGEEVAETFYEKEQIKKSLNLKK